MSTVLQSNPAPEPHTTPPVRLHTQLEDYTTSYRATRDAFLKGSNELALATGPYVAARHALPREQRFTERRRRLDDASWVAPSVFEETYKATRGAFEQACLGLFVECAAGGRAGSGSVRRSRRARSRHRACARGREQGTAGDGRGEESRRSRRRGERAVLVDGRSRRVHTSFSSTAPRWSMPAHR